KYKMEYILSGDLAKTEQQNASIAETVKRERGRLFNFIKNRVGAEADAEDILQDVLYQFVSAVRLEPIERAASWLFYAAGNKIIDWYRKIQPHSLDKMNESIFDDSEEALFRIENKTKHKIEKN